MLRRLSELLKRGTHLMGVSQLLSKRVNKTKGKSSSASVRLIFKKAITEAEKISVSMKMEAQKEAKAIAESIITQASKDARRIKRSAQTVAIGWVLMLKKVTQLFKRATQLVKRATQLLSKRVNKTKNLWGKEFKIVRKGLDEEQVVTFVNILLGEEDTLEESSSASVRLIFKKAITEAEKIRVGMKMKAQKEAEAMAESIITQTRQDAEEIKRSAQTAAQRESEYIISVANSSLRSMFKNAIAEAEKTGVSMKMEAQKEAEAKAESIITQTRQDAEEIKRSARIATQREAEGIISAAKRKAQAIEEEGEQKALLALLKASEEVKEEISEEYKGAYSRLSSSLQEMAMNAVQRIDMEFKEKKEKREKFWESRSFALNEKEEKLSGIFEAAAPPLETSAPAEIESIARKEEKQPARLEERGFAKGIEQLASHQEGSSLKAMEQPFPLKEEKIEQNRQLQELAAVSGPAKRAMEEPLAGPSGEEIAGRGETGSILPKDDREILYYSEVDLQMAMPVDLKIVTKLNDFLETVPDLKVLYSRGSIDRGTTITVRIEKPMPLIGIISKSKIADIQAMPESSEEGRTIDEKLNPLLKTRPKGVKRIKIIAKEAQTV